MKATLIFALVSCLALLVGCSGDRRTDSEFEGSRGGGEVEFEDFEEPLAEYGVWVEVDGYGTCWYPEDIDEDWRPYCHGHWVWVDECGWYWDSDYEWGWACEHYGRWVHHHHRWYWVPGYEWGGAWVVWRDGGGYVGWAPLHPDVHWSVSVGIRTDVHWDTVIYEPGWVFVAEVDFTAPHVRSVVLHSSEISVVVHKTKVKGSIGVSAGRPMNHAIKVHEAEKFTGKKAPRRKLEGADGPRDGKGDDGEKVKAYRPKARKSGESKGNRDDKPDRDTEKKPDGDKQKPDRDTEKKPDRDKQKPDRDTEKKPNRDKEKKPDPDKQKPDRDKNKKGSKGKGK